MRWVWIDDSASHTFRFERQNQHHCVAGPDVCANLQPATTATWCRVMACVGFLCLSAQTAAVWSEYEQQGERNERDRHEQEIDRYTLWKLCVIFVMMWVRRYEHMTKLTWTLSPFCELFGWSLWFIQSFAAWLAWSSLSNFLFVGKVCFVIFDFFFLPDIHVFRVVNEPDTIHLLSNCLISIHTIGYLFCKSSSCELGLIVCSDVATRLSKYLHTVTKARMCVCM